MLGICTSIPENFSEIKFCEIIQLDDVINPAKYLFNRFTRVSVARGQTSPFSVQTAYTVILPYNCDNMEISCLCIRVASPGEAMHVKPTV